MATASAGGGQRRKRAWRKPREAMGPPATADGDTSAHKAPRTEYHVQSRTEGGVSMSGGSGGSGGQTGPVQSESVQHVPVEPCMSSRDAPIEIDGSVMEGGGQILRNAMAMSCLLGQPIQVSQIRAGRDKPGLRPQHLTGIQLISRLCGGQLEGESVGSSQITFHPGAVRGGDFTADTKTAGSICLLLQAALPCLLYSPRPSKVTLKGGTNADMAPPIDYVTKVFQPIAEKFGITFECQLRKRGFYPKGGGEVIIAPAPLKELSPVNITDPGKVERVRIHAFVAGAVPPKVSRQLVHSARGLIQRELPNVKIDVNEVQETPATAFGNSSGIIVVAETSTGCLLAGSANGRKSDPAEKTGQSAAEELIRNIKEGGCVDEHLQDQLVILMALAKGRSAVRTGPVTLHTQTAIHIAQLMTQAKFTITKLDGEVNLLECEGIGLENKNL